MADHWAKGRRKWIYIYLITFYWIGGSGAIDLAHAVEKACLEKTDFKFLYDLQVMYIQSLLFFD